VPHFYAFSHLSLLAGWAAPCGAAILGARLPPTTLSPLADTPAVCHGRCRVTAL
jgi:hypothetical protein